jgi:hypothetical protein
MPSSGSPSPLGDVPIAAASPAGSVGSARSLQQGKTVGIAVEECVERLRDQFLSPVEKAQRLVREHLEAMGQCGRHFCAHST